MHIDTHQEQQTQWPNSEEHVKSSFQKRDNRQSPKGACNVNAKFRDCVFGEELFINMA